MSASDAAPAPWVTSIAAPLAVVASSVAAPAAGQVQKPNRRAGDGVKRYGRRADDCQLAACRTDNITRGYIATRADG
jgi:hypothetical protein